MLKQLKQQPWLRAIRVFVCLLFLGGDVSPVLAQMIRPQPSGLPQNILSQPIDAVQLRGVKVNPSQPLQLEFMLSDPSYGSRNQDEKNNGALNDEGRKLVQYFLAALTIPEDDFWVNLSPVEADRVIPASFGETRMGRDLLAQDYLLKQITASLFHPDNEYGQQFWQRVYDEAFARYGTIDIPVDTFHKVWIMPDVAEIYEKDSSVIVQKATLKVMMEQDYVAQQSQPSHVKRPTNRHSEGVYATEESWRSFAYAQDDNSSISTNVMKNVILPAIEHEVNTSARFATLRQIYHALILATWMKSKLKSDTKYVVGGTKEDHREGLSLSRRTTYHAPLTTYIDSQKTAGVDHGDSKAIPTIYDQYLNSVREGVFDFIREEEKRHSEQSEESSVRSFSRKLLQDDEAARHYFSGGFTTAQRLSQIIKPQQQLTYQSRHDFAMTVNLSPRLSDNAMAVGSLRDHKILNSKGQGLVQVWESDYQKRPRDANNDPDLRTMNIGIGPDGHNYVEEFLAMSRDDFTAVIRTMIEEEIFESLTYLLEQEGDLLIHFLDRVTHQDESDQVSMAGHYIRGAAGVGGKGAQEIIELYAAMGKEMDPKHKDKLLADDAKYAAVMKVLMLRSDNNLVDNDVKTQTEYPEHIPEFSQGNDEVNDTVVSTVDLGPDEDEPWYVQALQEGVLDLRIEKPSSDPQFELTDGYLTELMTEHDARFKRNLLEEQNSYEEDTRQALAYARAFAKKNDAFQMEMEIKAVGNIEANEGVIRQIKKDFDTFYRMMTNLHFHYEYGTPHPDDLNEAEKRVFAEAVRDYFEWSMSLARRLAVIEGDQEENDVETIQENSVGGDDDPRAASIVRHAGEAFSELFSWSNLLAGSVFNVLSVMNVEESDEYLFKYVEHAQGYWFMDDSRFNRLAASFLEKEPWHDRLMTVLMSVLKSNDQKISYDLIKEIHRGYAFDNPEYNHIIYSNFIGSHFALYLMGDNAYGGVISGVLERTQLTMVPASFKEHIAYLSEATENDLREAGFKDDMFDFARMWIDYLHQYLQSSR